MHRLYRWPLIALAALALNACVEDIDDGSTLQVRSASPAEAGEELGMDEGATVELSAEAREARVVIFDAILGSNPASPPSVEVARVVDTPLFVDDDAHDTDTHWITRARIEDAQGTSIWSERVNSLFQLLEFLNLLLAQQATVDLNANQVYALVRAQYPPLTQFATRVPTGVEGAQDYILELAQPDGSWVELGRFPIDELLEQAEPNSVDGEVDTIVESGPADDRMDIVILADGYTEEERALFEGDAQAVAERILLTSPFNEHRDLFNVHSVWTPSSESGAGYDCRFGQTECEGRLRDTVFETTFVIPAVADIFNIDIGEVSDRVALPIQVGRMFEAAALAQYDEIVLLSNTRKVSGFAGVYVSLVTTYDNRQSFPDTVVHELGHTLGMLGDEYMVDGDPCFFNEPFIPLPANIDELNEGEPLSWEAWVSEDAPLPTPPNQANTHPVGAYERAYNCEFLVRPSYECMMKDSGDDFCPVCAEQMVRRFYSGVDPTPNEAIQVERISPGIIEARVPRRDAPGRYAVTWYLGEREVGQGARLRLGGASFTGAESQGWVELRAEVTNTTAFLASEHPAINDEFTLWVKREDAP
ncbi:hypothetical protein FRC98_03450 [Lujinxingia vulgaris]|uniref:IgA Peptidase M64 n=1 Tax=Lujinxingia vulgaris TaxID=2600176 RepID=A0A5C6XMK9_9DELT|nr:M64 family metallopeptidase [Lujinxingia vulgaris]TXD39465.1 hypothetical protein FRC98_03450 [Lujinxingia vulgaris]